MADKNIGNFLLELGAEELPAGQISNISNHIKTELLKALDSAEISYKEVKQSSTPRRLFWSINDLSLEVEDKEVEIKGPPEKIAKAEDGSFTQAALGFAKKNNLEESALEFKDGYLYAKQTIKGQSAESVLETALPVILSNTPGVRFMRWADGEVKFARPMQWILALIVSAKGKKVLNFNVEGLKAGSISYGHRFLGPEAFEVTSYDQYYSQLEKQGVFLDQEARKKKIIEESKKLAASVKGEVIFSDDLLDEVILITENPSPILCEFDTAFLKVPDCVLQTVMINHQRYLPIQINGKLSQYFIAVSNNPLPAARENIKSGNEKVIVPRFKDAEFFVEEDMKKTLKQRTLELSRLNSIKGTMEAKVKRLEKITAKLVADLKPSYNDKNPAKLKEDKLDADTVKEATLLCKADLGTNLVFEFTELQGEIGGIYAEKEGYSKAVVTAISEHYKPRFAGDEPAKTIAGKLIAIADKLDNIVTSFALGKIPSGSADPFALRRQANGLLETVLHGHMILNLEDLVTYVVKIQEEEFGSGEMITKMKGRGEKRQEIQVPELEWDSCANKVIEFLEQRLEFVFSISHKDANIVKAILAKPHPFQELNKRHMMYHTVLDLKQEKNFADFVAAVTRISNIAKTETPVLSPDSINDKLFEGNYEKELLELVKPLDVNGSQNSSYEPILSSKDILKTVEPINKFFDNVLVNAEDEEIKKNRKALVAYADTVFKEIGDFSLL